MQVARLVTSTHMRCMFTDPGASLYTPAKALSYLAKPLWGLAFGSTLFQSAVNTLCSIQRKESLEAGLGASFEQQSEHTSATPFGQEMGSMVRK